MATRPPSSRPPSASVTSQPRRPRVRAASRPAGPAPITSTRSPFAGGTFSLCQPRRHSSPTTGFWVQRMGTAKKSPVMHMLQPMHSRMSSLRPSSIFFGRKGSAIAGRAAPMKSTMPDVTARSMASGLV